MTKKVIPIGIALAACSAFLLLVLSPGGCAFNLLPYVIHEAMAKGGDAESRFIRGFDILVGAGIFLLVYKIAKVELPKNPN